MTKKPTRTAVNDKATRKTSSNRVTRKKQAPDVATHKLVWRDTTCRVRHTRNYISRGWSHIEITVQTPKGAPLPITSTGYLSHFLDEDLLATAGGPVKFFLDWIEREAKTKQWQKVDFKWRQLDLFPRWPTKEPRIAPVLPGL